MAVYQYYLEFVPKQGIKKKHDTVPTEIAVSTETGFFESEAELYWKEVEMKADQISSKVDLMAKRATWGNDETSYNWKSYTDQVDNDASIYLDKDTLTIRAFSFRADLRENNFLFLRNMIELGKEKELLLMDRKGKLMAPDFEEIKNSIRNSNAYRFLKEPIEYLNKIDSQK